MNKLGLAALILAAALAGCATTPVGGADYTVPGLAAGVHFRGGDGSSVEKAVIVLGATEITGVPAEYRWLEYRYPGYKRGNQRLLNGSDGKLYDVLEFTTPDGVKHTAYFDIGDYFGKM